MHWIRLIGWMAALLSLATACGDDAAVPGDDDDDDVPTTVPVLGGGAHSIDAVDVLQIGSAADGLNGPRDLEFHNVRAGELWVVNQRDDSTTTFYATGTEGQTSTNIRDPAANHFMEEVSSIAFGAPDLFATCQETRNSYDDSRLPDGSIFYNDFMGPALWSADPAIYGLSNPEALDFLCAGVPPAQRDECRESFDLGSHLDMLHQSPLCMGIAWERDNVYWTFDGQVLPGDPGENDSVFAGNTISRYDFVADHGPGFDDHNDGIIEKHYFVEVARVRGVPSHMVFDPETNLLYVADTGNRRILTVDTTSGERESEIGPGGKTEPETEVWLVMNTVWSTLVDEAGGELVEPSGIALRGNLLFVGDHATGRVSAFDKRTGARIDWLETGLAGSLMGLELDAEGNLYAADFDGNAVWRYAPRAR